MLKHIVKNKQAVCLAVLQDRENTKNNAKTLGSILFLLENLFRDITRKIKTGKAKKHMLILELLAIETLTYASFMRKLGIDHSGIQVRSLLLRTCYRGDN